MNNGGVLSRGIPLLRVSRLMTDGASKGRGLEIRMKGGMRFEIKEGGAINKWRQYNTTCGVLES